MGSELQTFVPKVCLKLDSIYIDLTHFFLKEQ